MKHFSFLTSKVFLAIVTLILIGAAFLRLYRLDSLPPSLYWDEVSLGYDAYSILKTGKDHHGNQWPFLSFVSYGDYKPSGYFYAVVPFMAILGPTVAAVRLPSAVAGIFIVIGIGWLVRIIANDLWPKINIYQQRFAQLAGMAVAAVSTWLLQFSRGGWEVNLATAILLWSVLFGLWARTSQRRQLYMYLSIGFAASTMYIYHATRIVAPALMLGMFCIWLFDSLPKAKLLWAQLFQGGIRLLIPGIIFLLLAGPILLSSRSPQTQQRFAETSIAASGRYVTESNYLREVAANSPIARVFTHRYLILGKQILTNFASHFDLNFLFVSGDKNQRHSTGYTGILVLPDVIWLVLGIIALATAARQQPKARPLLLFLCWWLLVGIIPAAITEAAPHALRILPTAPVFLSIVIIGFLAATFWLSERVTPKQLFFILAGLSIVLGSYWCSYWRYYTRVYPVVAASAWQYGYQEMVHQLNQQMAQQPAVNVYVTREFGRPAMNYWFYSQTPPTDVQAAELTAPKDQAEFLSFQNIEFINSVNEAKPGIVASSADGYEQLLNDFASVEKLAEITDQRGHLVWVISQVTATPAAQLP